MKTQEKGFILYEGASLIDGAPIVVIATMKTTNGKTGDMVQVTIMRSDVEPHLAVKQGLDSSVCGDCVHRPANMGTCYVTVFQAPLSIFRAYKRGLYSSDTAELKAVLPYRKIRLGMYGDPFAAPMSVWDEYVPLSMGHTGYTHQWALPNFDPALLGYVMASADTEDQATELAKRGIRYFRVKKRGAPGLKGEVECLSDSRGMSCADCLVCDGGDKGKSIYIDVHGAKASKFNPDLIAVA